MSYVDAVEYVGTTPESGVAQLAILHDSGLRPDHRVLEIGCGALHLARPLVEYLDVDRYCGVDPNAWLREAAWTEDPALADLLRARSARFYSGDRFRWPGRAGFDRIVAHSVLTHVSRPQIDTFARALDEQLTPDGIAVVSLLLDVETNAADEWTYPESITIAEGDLAELLAMVDLVATRIPAYRESMREIRPAECHDWIVIERA
jgi:cyclopropane fatty-acyl-phospholipid synthase-like methyltransferase